MNSYQKYMAENDLAYCTLFPNVGDVFPLAWTAENLIQICSLEKLSQIKELEFELKHWEDIQKRFKAEDLCFCFQQGILLLPTWDGQSDSYQKLNIGDSLRLDKLDLDQHKPKDCLLKADLDFDFHELDDNIPWINSHIFLLNSQWSQVPNTCESAQWSLVVEEVTTISAWEQIHQLSFNIQIDHQLKFQIPLSYNSLGEKKQSTIIYYD